MTPVYGLFGSGEFLPWADPVDRRLVELSAAEGGRVLVVPTASAPEGEAVFRRWATMGVEHYRSLGFDPEVAEIKVREDAERADIAAAVQGAALVFFSGGNPAQLCRTFKGTAFWAAVEAAVAGGTALAGSSAGIAFLGAVTIDSAMAAAGSLEDLWVDGLGYFANTVFGPHWDAMERWAPGSQALMLGAAAADGSFLGIDEDTAVVGDGRRWEVLGRGTATVRAPGKETIVVASGDAFDLDLIPGAG